jgi:hypothetical protein
VTTPAPPRDLRRLVRRRVLQTLAVVFFIMLAGMTYQGVASAFERARLPHPGQLIDVGGHQLHIHCTGDGAPTVVLEADAGMPSVAWSAVQPTLSAATRTCSYDRTGLGWSETGDRRFEVTRVAEELRTLLANAGERPPFSRERTHRTSPRSCWSIARSCSGRRGASRAQRHGSRESVCGG